MLKTIPKVPVLPKTQHMDKRKFHTLHLIDNVFTVQNNGTAIVSFRNKSDALHLGKMLESHFDMTHEWPVINFEDSILFRQSKINRLKYLKLKSWEEDKLCEFCIKNNFSMLDIFKFENDFKLIGRSISWEASPEYYIELLNKRFKC